MRLPYAPSSPPEGASSSDVAIYDRIATRRAPRPLIPLDLALLHSPSVADGWNSFLGAIRSKTTIDVAIGELAISRVAVLNNAGFEWKAHAPLALKAGVSSEALETVRTAEMGTKGKDREGGLSAKEWAVMAYTDQMTKNVTVDEETFATLREHFNDQEVVEITATVAAYNCVSRFLVALDVGEMNGKALETAQQLSSK
jgi:alkylhydroperoxidase family enzyme